MTVHSIRTVLLAALVPLLFAGSGLAIAATPQDTNDQSIELSALEARLKPLTKTELEELATTWVGHVQSAENKVADAVIAGDDDAKSTALAGRAGVIDRASAVFAELSLKGGDASEHETYIANLHGAEAPEESVGDQAEKAAAFVTSISEWMVSMDGGIAWAIKIGVFLAILLISKIVSKILGKIVARAVNKLKGASSLLKDFFVTTVVKLTTFIGFVFGLSFLGMDIGPFLAALGAAGFIIGFALQGTLSNFASGVMILVYRPYDIGDVVTAAGVTGKVEAMTLVSTSLITPDNQVIIIPNGAIWGSVITNITARDTRRVDMVFGIGYEDDIAKAEKILIETLSNHPKVLKDKDVTVKLHELADSSVNFIARPWSKTADYWDVYWDLQREVKERFDAAGISIPYPQSDVHVHGLPQGASSAKA